MSLLPPSYPPFPPSLLPFAFLSRPRSMVQPLGGTCDGNRWDWFSGYSPRFGDLAKLVKNWDGKCNKTPHDFFFR